MATEGLTTGEAAKYLGRHPKTLQGWDKDGTLPAHRTPKGRRYWLQRDLDAFQGKKYLETARRKVVYCRVSSQAQRPDLKNQRRVIEDFLLAKGLDGYEYIDEIGGGLNFKRKQFLALVDEIVQGNVESLVLAHKDRLARFGFDLLSHLCTTHSCSLIILNTEQLSPEQEMVQDLMAITHCFSSRLYGLRNYRKALTEALK